MKNKHTKEERGKKKEEKRKKKEERRKKKEEKRKKKDGRREKSEERRKILAKAVEEYVNDPYITVRDLAKKYGLDRWEISLVIKKKHGEIVKKKKNVEFIHQKRKKIF